MPSDNNPTDAHNALATGERLHEFEIRGVLGVGGFGIVYTAFDTALEREVALKEYMPASLAARSSTRQVSVLSQSHAETFALGLRSFVNEARLLARFDHPALVKVHRFWEANGTAYMVMPLYRGRTLREVRAGMTEPPHEQWLRDFLMPLLGALDVLHREDVYHRDIAPDNILELDDGGAPLLLDFGAARRVISDKSQALTAILKPHYAPIEQYGETPGLRQGPWTDFYALGATLHYMIVGAPPMPSTARMLSDDQVQLAAQARPGIGTPFLQVVDWMLAPRPSDRPQRVSEIRQALLGQLEIPVRVAAPATTSWVRTQIQASHRPGTVPPQGSATDQDATQVQPARPPAAVADLPLEDLASTKTMAVPRSRPMPPPPVVPTTAPTPGAGGGRWVAVGAVALVGAAAAALLLSRNSAPVAQAPTPQGATVVVATPADPTLTKPAPAPSPAPIVLAAPAPSPPAPIPAAKPSIVPATPTPGPRSTPGPATKPAVPTTQPMPARVDSAGVAAATPPRASPPANRPAAVPGATAGAAPAPMTAAAPSPAQPAAPSNFGGSSGGAPSVAQPTAEPPAPIVAPTAPAPATGEAASPNAAKAAAGLMDPRERCGNRMLIALHRCLVRTCDDPIYAKHKECVRVHGLEEENRNRRF